MVDFDDDSWFGELFTKKPANKAKKKNAMGGPVNKDELYMVGEQGPELMIPDTAGMIMPNNQLPTLSPGVGAMAGPAGGIAGGMGDTTSFFNSLGESATPAIETGAAAGGGMQNALGEAQLARLDMLINETSRANQINTKILQAARS